MTDIILRNGKTLTYNGVEEMCVEDGVLKLTEGKYLIALVPFEQVERAEYRKPCKIIYPRKKKK